MAVKFTNNAATTLAAGINSSATSISVTDGSVFPAITGSDHFYVTFDDTTNTEIVKVTARSGNTLTVVRGQDDTTARAFSSGDKAELRVVAALLEDVKTEVTSTLNVDTFTSDGTSAAFTLSQAPSSEDNLIVFIEGVYQNPGDFTLSGTTLTLDAVPPNTRKVVAYHVSGAVSGNNLNHDQFTANGSTAAFTLSISPIHENNTQVFIDGVYQQKDSYSVSGTTLTLDANPANGAKVEVMTFTQTDVNTLPASFVSGLTEVTAVGADHFMIFDATDSALKKSLVSDVLESATSISTSADATAITINSSEQVGIGTTNPQILLHVQADDGVSANNYVAAFQNLEATDGESFGVTINAGSNATDIPLNITTHDAGSVLFRLKGSGELGIGSGTTYSSSLIAADIGTRDNTIYSTSTDAGNHIVLRDNSSTANISYGTEGNTHVLQSDGTDRLHVDGDGLKVFGGAAGTGGVRVNGMSQGEQLARQYCARTGGSIRYISAGSGSLNNDLDAVSDGDALLIKAGSYTITRKTSGYVAEHNPFRDKEVGVFGDTSNPADVTISHNADADSDIRDHPIWSSAWSGVYTYPLFLGFIKYVRNPSTVINTNYSDAFITATHSNGSVQQIFGGAQNVLFDFNNTDVAWIYDNNSRVHYMRFKNCTFSNYNTWEASYSGNLADSYVWHCVFEGSDTISGNYNAVGTDIASTSGSISNRTLLSKGNRHGVSLSSGSYNTTTYAGAGHLQYDQYPTIFWDDSNWDGGF